MAKVFFSYSHADEALRNRLETHLAPLKREGSIKSWHDRRILAGSDLDSEIEKNLAEADVVLLLVSAEFLASEYCYTREFRQAMAQRQQGRTQVIPIILRACDWQPTPLGKLRATPTDGRPVVEWAYEDRAWLEVVNAIRAVLNSGDNGASSASAPEGRGVDTALGKENRVAAAAPRVASHGHSAPIRSSNLRVRQHFTDEDRLTFLETAFGFMQRFFGESIDELSRRNPGITGRVQQDGPRHFQALVFRGGRQVATCNIRLVSGGLGASDGINFSHGDDRGGRSWNESLSVVDGEQSLGLRPMGMALRDSDARQEALSEEGAAEAYWGLFIEPLQR